MPLSNSDNIQSGLEICKDRLLFIRNRFRYILEHQESGLEKEALLDTLEHEVDGLCDSVNVLLCLKKEL